jgi:spore coat polysaccharide biosynthesis protein SpsF
MTTLVVIQARMGSSRLPGKVAKPLAGAPLLVRMIERVRAARTPFEISVATSVLDMDDGIVELARSADVRWFRGDPLDCLGRHLGAAEDARADHVVKIPSDCPLIDPGVIDEVLGLYFEAPGAFDFVSNLHPASWPDGNDVEVFSTELLRLADREAKRPLEREHTTPFFWEQPERFRLGNAKWSTGLDYSMSHRFTIDYPEDYAFISAVYDALYEPGAPARSSERRYPVFSLDDILRLVENRPDIRALNEKYAGVNWYRNHLGDLRTVTADMTRTSPADPRSDDKP